MKDEDYSQYAEQLVSGMNKFVNKVSNFEGAEFPNEKVNKNVKVTRENKYTNDEDSEEEESEILSDEEDLDEMSDEDNSIKSLMKQMDNELKHSSNVMNSFEKCTNTIEPENDNDEELQDADINYNLIKNMLESYSAQEGMAGPVSNILNSMNLPIFDNDDTLKNSKSNK